jgi:hypothetical protein
VSLQGSLDTFALPDVLVLLASTGKSGELRVAGRRSATGRGTELEGRLWFDGGRLTAADLGDPTDAVFELLRLVEGTFSFGFGAAPDPRPAMAVEPVLAEAQARLSEWREIERVVPSLSAWLELAADAPSAHVSIRADQWRLVVAVGGGCTVDAALGRLGLAELPGCRAVKELVEAELLMLRAEREAGRDLAREVDPEPVVEEPAWDWSDPRVVDSLPRGSPDPGSRHRGSRDRGSRAPSPRRCPRPCRRWLRPRRPMSWRR